MRFIHFAGCPVWADAGPCTCPRAWRIRKDRAPGDATKAEHPWLVARRDSHGNYTVMMRARTWAKALSLVEALEAAAARVLAHPERFRSAERCPRPW